MFYPVGCLLRAGGSAFGDLRRCSRLFSIFVSQVLYSFDLVIKQFQSRLDFFY